MGVQDPGLAPTVDPNHTVTVGGRLYGGANPIVGATVTFYVTGSSYGTYSTSTQANTISGQSTGYDTDSNGNFSFGTVTCPTGSQKYAYVVSAGGKPGPSTRSSRRRIRPVRSRAMTS